MPNLTRYNQNIFGSTAGLNQMAEYGSFAAGTPARYDGSTITPDLVQALSNYLEGWYAAVVGVTSPTVEDMNSLCYLFSYQLAYILQKGVAQWIATTTYYTGCIVSVSGQLYVSLQDTNLNKAPATQSAWWRIIPTGGLQQSKTANYTVLLTDGFIRANATGGAFTITLPTAASTPKGWQITIKKVDSSANAITVSGDVNIDLVASVALDAGSSVTLVYNGTTWDII